MIRTQTFMDKRFTWILIIVMFCVVRSVFAKDPDWYIKKDSWIETYLESINSICAGEKEQGRGFVSNKNDGKLPAVVFCEYGWRLGEIPLEVDVTGVEKLYLGSSATGQFPEVALVKEDGTQLRLVVDGKLTVDYVKINERGRLLLREPLELYDNEVELMLGGKYRRLVGKIRSHEGAVVWIDSRSHLNEWKDTSRIRRDARSMADRVINERYSDRRDANDARNYFHQVLWALPSGFCPVDYSKAALHYEQSLRERHGKNADERIVGVLRTAAEAVKSCEDFGRLVRLSFALTNYGNFSQMRNRSKGTAECPGLAAAFKTIEDRFFELDADRLDYGLELRKKLEDFGELIDECVLARKLVEIAERTIEFVDPLASVSDETRRRLATLNTELEENINDLEKYLATRDQIRKLRREVLFSHPALDFDRILINRTPPSAYSHNGDQHLGRHSRLGPGLTILSDWKSDTPKVTTPLEGKLPQGSVRNPDMHYDAEKIVFAFCAHSPDVPRNERRFFLYEAALDGSWLRQLTGTKRDPLDTWMDRATVLIEDNDPAYLPDGGIVFISTRSQSFGRCHGGRYNPAWVLHRCNGDGDHIRQLSFNNENEYEPSVLNDGRIVFTRWEYTNRHEMFFHMLWACRPDGMGISHYYGNDTIHPMMVVEASAIPGTGRIVATAQGHHSYNTGTTIVLDINKGENGEAPVTHITPETPYSETRGWPKPHYSHPYAITENLFLVSRANHPVHPQGQTPPLADRAIYLVDTLGGRELIYEDLEVASFSPIPIRKRLRPPALAPMVAGKLPDYGTLFIQNAYLTRNDPQGKITPGMIKAIRVNALGVQPRASRSACSMTVGVEIPKKVLGTVPIEEDGSVHFKVPARTSLQLQLLDENGMAILTEKSFFYLQPGEKRSCVGCHEPLGSSAGTGTIARAARMAPRDLTPPAGPQYKGGLSFMRTVQPVIDRHCISCHGLEKTEKVNLVHDGQTYPQSYKALVALGDHRIGQKGYKTDENTISRPFEYFAHGSKLPGMLLADHGDVKVDRDSFMRIVEWLDLNAQCYGDLFPNKLEERRIDAKALAKLRSYAAELLGEKIAAQPERALINVAQPEESRILMAPLAEDSGGWGQIDAWKNKDDPGYKKMQTLVAKCIIKRPDENRNGWAPDLKSGAGEGWIVKARENFRQRVQKQL